MKFSWIAVAIIFLTSCGGISKVLKHPEPEYKLRMAEQYFAKKQYGKAQLIYEDIMPFYKTTKEFEDIYYKYAYCAFYQMDYLNAENLFKTYVEIFSTSPRAEEADYMRGFSLYKLSPKAELDQTNTVKTIGMMQTFINTHPGSDRNKEANRIIDELRAKLENKDHKAAQLYYDIGQFRAAGVAFTALMNTYPESMNADHYKLMVIKSYFRYAELSVQAKQPERYEQVITEVHEFIDRFPDSKLREQAEKFLNQSQNNIKNISNEQTKTST